MPVSSSAPPSIIVHGISVTYRIGDRVFIQGHDQEEKNGMHGTVGTGRLVHGRYGIDLDLLPSTRIMVSGENLRSEGSTVADKRVAKVYQGALLPSEGKIVSYYLDLIRVLAANSKDPSSCTTMQDLEEWRRNKDDKDWTPKEKLLRLQMLTAQAWSYWTSCSVEGNGPGTYGLTRRYIQGLRSKEKEIQPVFEKEHINWNWILQAVDDYEAVRGWNVRVTGDFWVCNGSSDTNSSTENPSNGTFLLPVKNPRVVYQCVGVKDAIWPQIPKRRPVVLTVTMIPWYGRLVYDGVLTPPSTVIQQADPAKEKELRNYVFLAQKEGRVITKLRQLEVTNGSKKGLYEQFKQIAALQDNQRAQPSTEETENRSPNRH